MKAAFDRNLFTQIGLDSASLTMLGSIVHSFSEPGEYRGSLHQGEQVKAVFYITSDRRSPVAQAGIDLAALEKGGQQSPAEDSKCSAARDSNRFSVNPRGYALFHVSGGAAGYHVNVRRIDAQETDRGYDSRVLTEGDIFSAVIIRPGTYSVTNELTRATGEIVVSYPRIEEKRYRPPNPVNIECGQQSFEPSSVALQPAQGMLFHARVHSHIIIRLLRPDDGPQRPEAAASRTGWKKTSLE